MSEELSNVQRLEVDVVFRENCEWVTEMITQALTAEGEAREAIMARVGLRLVSEYSLIANPRYAHGDQRTAWK